jgi:hypothetical protein
MVAANYVPEAIAEQVKQFARRLAPEIAVGVMDFEGLRSFAGHGIERFNSERPRAGNLPSRGLVRPLHSFFPISINGC